MKAIVVYFLVTATLQVYEIDAIYELRNPYKHLFRSIRSNQICTPGSTKMVDCNSCSCSTHGSEWFCTEMRCPQKIDVHSIPDDSDVRPNEVNLVLLGSELEKECVEEGTERVTDCYTCYCDENGFYSTCYSRKECDPYNFRD